MPTPVISIEGLGKAYMLGAQAEKYPTFRDAIVAAAKSPFERFRRLSGRMDEQNLFWALKDASFEVQRGEVVALIGRNGSGKSTLLKILSRIIDPTQGQARLRGRVASLLEVGTGFHAELSGRENIYLNGAMLGMRKSEIDRKFDQIVAFAETEKFLDTPVKRYSSGMYVRLAFAVAAHLEPEILFVDEVLAVGDAEFQKKCLGRMQEVAEGEGRTILFVSHNMAAVRRLCNRAVHLSAGKVVAVGPTEEIVKDYLSSSTGHGGRTAVGDRVRGPGLTRIITGFACRPAKQSQSLCSGGSVMFELECDLPQTLRNAAIGIHIDSDQGARLLSFNTRCEVGFLTLQAGRQTFRCHIDNLPLAPGRYNVDLTIFSTGKPMDWVEDAAVLDIEFSDYFGTGEMPFPNETRVLNRAKWEL